jgi:lysophospholipase L1-like esterase
MLSDINTKNHTQKIPSMKFFKLLALSLPVLIAGSTALADPTPFRQHRYNAFKAIPPVEENSQTIFYGNSITNMHEWWEAFGSDASICNRGTGGGTVPELLDNVEGVIVNKPKKLFLHIGTNDLATSYTVEETALNIRTLVKHIHVVSPETKIYLEGIIPRQGDIYTKIQATNALLKEFCDDIAAATTDGSDPYVEYIDLSETLIGIRTPSYDSNSYTTDGVHPTGYAYREWVKKITDKVNNKVGYVDDVDNVFSTFTRSYAMRLSQLGMFPINDDDVLILGDELIHGGEWHELLKSDKVKGRGNGWDYNNGTSLADLPKWLTVCLKNNSSQKSPAKIFMHYGTLDANSSSSDDARSTFKSRYKAVIDTIHKMCPTTPLYVMSLVPTSGTLDNVKACNDSLKAIVADENYKDFVQYVDIYTPLLNDAGTQNSDYFTNNYLYARGYMKVANVLADYIPGTTKIDEAEFEKYYADRNYRNSVGSKLNTLLKIEVGDDVNQFSTDAQTVIDNGISQICAILNSGEYVTADDVTTASNIVSSTLSAINDYLNLPTEKDADGNTLWYRITSLRGNRSLTDCGGNKLSGLTYSANASTGEELWKFVKRDDGTFDIVNQRYNTYLAPASPIATSDTQPESGWTISYSSYSSGSYIIYMGTTAQLNQMANGNDVLNWGILSNTATRTDEGCSYTFKLFSGTNYDADKLITTGWYNIDIASGLDSYINAGTNHILNADSEYLQNTSNSYSLRFGASPDAGSEVKAFIHVTTTGSGLQSSSIQFTGLNGHGIKANSTANSASLSSDTPSVTVVNYDDCIYSIGKWSDFNTGNLIYVGQSSGSNNTYKFTRVADDVIANYDIWTVTICNATAGSQAYYDTSVTLNDVENAGIATVYNGGTFFLPAGTPLSAANITVNPSNNEAADATPLVTLNESTHSIYVDYSESALETGWYTIDLATGDGDTLTSKQDYSTYVSSDTNHVLNADEEYCQSSTGNYFPLTIGEVPTDAPAKAFIKVSRAGSADNAYALTALDGHGINSIIASDRSQTASSFSNFTWKSGNLYELQYWAIMTLNGTTIVGCSYGSSPNYFTVTPAAIDDYDIYTVAITNQVDADEVGKDVRVALNTDANKGLAKVYNGGTFFVTKDAEITEDMIEAEANNGISDPIITIEGNVISVDYTSGITTGITRPNVDAAPRAIYDITGRRLNAIGSRGLYIVDGKKVFVQ